MPAVYLPQSVAFTNPRLTFLYRFLMACAIAAAVYNFFVARAYLQYVSPKTHIYAYVDGWNDEKNVRLAQEGTFAKAFCDEGTRRTYDYFYEGGWRYDDVQCPRLCGEGETDLLNGCLKPSDLFLKLSSTDLFFPTYIDEVMTLRGAGKDSSEEERRFYVTGTHALSLVFRHKYRVEQPRGAGEMRGSSRNASDNILSVVLHAGREFPEVDDASELESAGGRPSLSSAGESRAARRTGRRLGAHGQRLGA